MRPSFSRAFLVALAGWFCSEESGPATMPCAPISASHVRPSSSALARLMTTTAESLAKLRPAFGKEGTITAGSASQISDGACAVVVMSRAKAEELGLEWLCEIGASGQVAGPDSTLQLQPAKATAKALEKEGISIDDVDLVEFNEAFAAVGIESARQLGIPEEKVNVNGGAIALGHPIGASGARIALALAYELKRRGGGQGDALLLRVPA